MRRTPLAVAVVFCAGALLAGDGNPFGVCSHLTRHSFGNRDRILRMMADARLDDARCDLDWSSLQRADGTWNFEQVDALLASARKAGVRLLPILGAIPKNMTPLREHLDGFREYVEQTMRHVGADCPAIEVFNEENIWFDSDQQNPTNYLETLKVAYSTIKKTHPNTRVCLGGVAGIGKDFITELYRLGGAPFFDVVCCHAYTIPYAPEGRLERDIASLRELMDSFGDKAKPIWISEAGFPTHRNGIGTSETQILLTGLKIANPVRTSWRILCAPIVQDGKAVSQDFAEEMLAVLPAGSTVTCCSPSELKAFLARRDAVDAVVLPTDSEGYVGSTIEAITAWVRGGGVLVELGGAPLYYAFCHDAGGNVVDDKTRDTEHDRAALGIGFAAWWIDKTFPKKGHVHAAPEALVFGLKAHPAGYETDLFLTDRYLKPGETMIPLLSGKTDGGTNLVAAAVYKVGPQGCGSVIVSCLRAGYGPVAHTEEQQALYLARYAAIAAALGVEKFYAYEMMAMEFDPYDSESHFGIVHANGVPKPAYCAYATLTGQRPAGSVQRPGSWHDANFSTYCPQWTRPDGTKGGAFWTSGVPKTVDIVFDAEKVTFLNAFGLPLAPCLVAPKTYRVKFSESPIYFSGGYVLGKTQKSAGECPR